MKNWLKILGIIALAAVIGFAFIACPGEEEEEEEGADLSGNITIAPAGPVEVGIELTATYSGSEAVSFQWKKDGSNVGTASTTKPNKYTPTAAGSYTVTVSAEGFKSKTSAAVTVNPEPVSTFPVLFGNGVWTKEVGTVTIDPKWVKTGNTYVLKNSVDGDDDYSNDNKGFIFGSAINATSYTKLVITVAENSDGFGYWGGGELYTYYAEGYEDEDGDTVYYAKYPGDSGWSGDMATNKAFTFTFADFGDFEIDDGDTELPFDITKLYGFWIKGGGSGTVTITKVELVK